LYYYIYKERKKGTKNEKTLYYAAGGRNDWGQFSYSK